MLLDAHVHAAAFGPPGNPDGFVSDRLLNTVPFRFMRWRFGLLGNDARAQHQAELTLAAALDATPELDAAVILAFDAVYRDDGSVDLANTQFHVSNDYVMRLCRQHRKMLFGASVNPLLSHTGGEQSLIRLNDAYADPRLLEPALQHGVTVIAAHCGTRSRPFETDYFGTFVQMLRQYPTLYGDTAALSLPMRNYAYKRILADPLVRERVIHGSDWPILPLPPARQLGASTANEMLEERNWLRRDLLIKQRLGFDADYWQRADRLLRVSERGLTTAEKSS